MNLVKQWYHPQISISGNYEKKRNYFLDNLKFVLITFVVICHFALKLTYVKEIKYILYLIYIFHMPCFIFINGFFAKRMNTGGKLRVNRIFSVFWMYLLFKVGNVLLEYLFHQQVKLSLFKDVSAPWYLLALCLWYLSVPCLERIKTEYLILGSFLVGLFAGYIKSLGEIFSLSRVFVFFPFFIIGFCLTEDRLEKFLDKRLRLPALLFIVVVFSCLALFWKRLSPFISIIYGSSPYSKSFGDIAKYGFLIRGIWYLFAVVLSVALMLLVPRCKMFFSSLGERTLQVYMMHIWIRNALSYAGFFAIVKAGPAYYALLVFVGSIALTFLLANRWLKKLFDFLMAPRLFDKLMKQD
ncbi:MAG: acyltransferase family protein [Herbinix sp.]|nr:acyltransferase family protein [Herbinix sp.]